ncbi:hypothetical protein HPG69_019686 [Diceros bicornis minor]|uniref:Uncharacterized protein n=1 Tax=Diceros bicornis minor TaxID=77932 RepID=A0A7J7E6F6_DICBM|nr:hypothetical protein HPG69_019686 [Diceros bicornis minor]
MKPASRGKRRGKRRICLRVVVVGNDSEESGQSPVKKGRMGHDREKESTAALNKKSHRMDKSSNWAVQTTEEMVTALGHFGLRCGCRQLPQRPRQPAPSRPRAPAKTEAARTRRRAAPSARDGRAVFLPPSPFPKPRLPLKGCGFLLLHYWNDRHASQSEQTLLARPAPCWSSGSFPLTQESFPKRGNRHEERRGCRPPLLRQPPRVPAARRQPRTQLLQPQLMPPSPAAPT